jgi:hypothetical protein
MSQKTAVIKHCPKCLTHATTMMAGPKFRLDTFQIRIRRNASSSSLLGVFICGLFVDAICNQFCVGSEVWTINCKESGVIRRSLI